VQNIAALRYVVHHISNQFLDESAQGARAVPFFQRFDASSRMRPGEFQVHDSIASSLPNCLVSAFFGSVRMETIWSSVQFASVVTTGKRPMNSG